MQHKVNRSSTKNKSKTLKNRNSKSNVWVLILTGLPGCGKSKVSSQLEKFGWIRICQDELGSQEECKKLMHKALKHGKSVIIDRCNVHVKERKMWILEAQKAEVTNIESLFLNPGIEVCKQRVRERKWHPTLSPENGDSVIEDFAQTLKAPEKWEGFQKIMIATSDEELKQIIKEISDYPVETKKL